MGCCCSVHCFVPILILSHEMQDPEALEICLDNWPVWSDTARSLIEDLLEPFF